MRILFIAIALSLLSIDASAQSSAEIFTNELAFMAHLFSLIDFVPLGNGTGDPKL